VSLAPEAIAADIRPLTRAFLISELKSALSIGVMLLVPFVVTDILVAHFLTLVGISSLSAAVVSLPLKLLLFLAVDGWTLLAKKLLGM
jgi:flagellar biosynthesis protein FliP